MKEYIDCITKHRAKHFVCEFCNEHCSDEPCEPSDCEWMQYIENEPAADVVEVVRCKDCEYYENGECVNPYIWMNDGAHLWPDEDFYCAKGERRSEP